MNRPIVFVGSLVVVGMAAVAGCGGSTDVPVLQNGASDLGVIDSGTGKCGAAACGAGELCCAGPDESCSPTCMKVGSCPAYGRPCKVDAGDGDGGTTTLQWYTTCGDPVCRAPDDAGVADAGVPCPAPVGASCTTKGETCGNPNANCGVVQVCDDHDPKGGVGGCPISTRKLKDGISYVGDAELAKLHDETLRMKLATYRYKGPLVDPNDPNAKHLGFIVEDQPESLSVDRGHDRVDLYGYMSMAVATMQVQDKQIRDLKKEIEDVKASCKKK
jgi:hypothetical protein